MRTFLRNTIKITSRIAIPLTIAYFPISHMKSSKTTIDTIFFQYNGDDIKIEVISKYNSITLNHHIRNLIDTNNIRQLRNFFRNGLLPTTPIYRDTINGQDVDLNIINYIAAFSKNTDLLDLVLEYGGNINDITNYQKTPLEIAIYYRNFDMANYMIELSVPTFSLCRLTTTKRYSYECKHIFTDLAYFWHVFTTFPDESINYICNHANFDTSSFDIETLIKYINKNAIRFKNFFYVNGNINTEFKTLE